MFRHLRNVSFRRFYTSSQPSVLIREQKSRKRAVATGGLLFAAAVSYFDDDLRNKISFSAHAVQRTSTVLLAVSKCCFHYRKVLKTEYTSPDLRQQALDACHTKCALTARHAIERNRGVFIKLGQHISALTYIFPKQWTDTMIPLQDQCPISALHEVQELFLKETGTEIGEKFSEFDVLPIGTASLAQVHRASLPNGTQVAVKIQHPSLQQYIPLDLKLTEKVFEMVDYFFPDYPLTWLSKEMQNTVFMELDFRTEAKHAIETSKKFKQYYNDTALRIPEVYESYKKVICMEYLPGIKPNDLDSLKLAHIDLKKLDKCFTHIFSLMLFKDGMDIHCDPHSGNIAILPSNNRQGFEIILYDHGLYRSIPLHTRYAYAKFWLSMLNQDAKGMQKYAQQFVEISDFDFQVFSAAITGRDFQSAVDGSYFKTLRSQDEIHKMKSSLSTTNLPSRIIKMLKQVPSLVLLILKTNDLIRCLDEQLNHPLNPKQQFSIMAKYCNRLVLETEGWRGIFMFIKTWFKLEVLNFM